MDLETKQSRMLQVCGIILVIRGVLLTAFSLLAVTAGSQPAQLCQFCVYDMRYYRFIPIFLLLDGTVNLPVGIQGILSWKKPKQASRCFLLGIVALSAHIAILTFVRILYAFASAGCAINSQPFGMLDVLMIGLYAIPHILYIAGAYALKKEMKHENPLL